jgi:hypothetical protein
MFTSSLFFVASALRAGASSNRDEAVLDVTAVYFFFWVNDCLIRRQQRGNHESHGIFCSFILLFSSSSSSFPLFLCGSVPNRGLFSFLSLFKSERAARSRLINWYWPCWTRGRLAGCDIYTARRCTQGGARDIFAVSEGIFGGICGIMDHEESSTGSTLCLDSCGRKPFPGKIDQVIRIPREFPFSFFPAHDNSRPRSTIGPVSWSRINRGSHGNMVRPVRCESM